MKVRQAVIMVGGKGTRLRPLTDTCPKPVLPVLDRPCLDYLIDSMARGGVEHIILACGYRSEQVTNAIGDGSSRNIKIEYSYEDGPMGTAGAIKLIENKLDDVFIAANGDVFADIDIAAEINDHFNSGACVTISLTHVPNPCEFGIARVDNSGRITEFKEKPKQEEVFSDLINAGVYVVNKDVLKLVPKGEMYDFSKELLMDLMRRGERIQGHTISGVWKDVGRPIDLINSNLVMAGRNKSIGKTSESDLESPYFVGKEATVKRSSLRSSVVSRRSSVTDSVISGSLVMENCIISGSEMTNTIIGKGCRITNSKLSDMVVGDGTVLEGKTMKGDQNV